MIHYVSIFLLLNILNIKQYIKDAPLGTGTISDAVLNFVKQLKELRMWEKNQCKTSAY